MYSAYFLLGANANLICFPFLQDHVGQVLGRSGLSVLVPALCRIAAFLVAAVVPVPALRVMALQCAVLLSVNLLAMLLLMPAAMALDLRRQAAGKRDLLCCYRSAAKTHAVPSPPPERVVDEEEEEDDDEKACFTPGTVVSEKCLPLLTKAPVRLLVILGAVALTLTGAWGIVHVEDGLDLADIVPQNTSVHAFLQAQGKYFGFYHMYAVTQGQFEYPQNQKLLYDYQSAFVRVHNIIKNDDGGLPEFWLSLFRAWLVKLQVAFDDDLAVGKVFEGGWHSNASEDAVLAYKLLVQTGHVDYPVDETLLLRNRLVDVHGIINPSAFYNYLSAWYTNDAMAYSFSQGNLVPMPKEWLHDAKDLDLKVPKSPAITYAQIPFYLNNVGETDAMVETIRHVREVCAKFEEKGLPNFPRGVPFTFWEQYVSLRFWLLVALVAILVAVFVAVAAAMMSAWLGAVATAVVSLVLVQLFGFVGLMGIRLSAVPAVILIVAPGIAVQFVVHLCMVSIYRLSNNSLTSCIRLARTHYVRSSIDMFPSLVLELLLLERQQGGARAVRAEERLRAGGPRHGVHLPRHRDARLLALRLHLQVRFVIYLFPFPRFTLNTGRH
jgi:patched 1 protein